MKIASPPNLITDIEKRSWKHTGKLQQAIGLANRRHASIRNPQNTIFMIRNFIAIATISAASILTSHAAVIVDSGLTGILNSTLSGGTGGAGKAVGFKIGTQAYTLDSVDIRLVTGTTPPSAAQMNFGIFLGNDSGITSASASAVFNDPTLTASTTANYNLTLTASFTLQANTTYWFAAYSTDTTIASLGWAYNTAGQNATTIPGVTITTTEGRFFNPGNTVTNPTTWSGTSTTYNAVAINATAVPEPATWALLAFSLAAVVVLRRRRA